MQGWIEELRNYTNNSFTKVEQFQDMKEDLTNFVRRAEYTKAQVLHPGVELRAII